MFYKHYIWARNQIHEANIFTVDPFDIGRQFNESNGFNQGQIIKGLWQETAFRYAVSGFELG